MNINELNLRDFYVRLNLNLSIINNFPSTFFLKIFFGIVALILLLGIYSVVVTLDQGLGVWGINNEQSWAFDIVNFVFWIGIAHCGTLISAILLVLNQGWRSSINRIAETITVSALVVAIFFPIIHTGRPWLAIYWLLPYPNQMDLLPNFHSPLIWDVFAILTYFIVSIAFWLIGVVPELALIKNEIKSPFKKFVAKCLSFGLNPSEINYSVYRRVYLILGGIATALVISVHSIVALDFAITIVPGWHNTLFPLYFIAGAIFSGCAMLILVTFVLKKVLLLENVIDGKQIENLNKITLFTSVFLLYVFIVEMFQGWMGWGDDVLFKVTIGKFGFLFFLMLFCVIIVPQLYWFRKIRDNFFISVIISVLLLFGIWLERFIIIVPALTFHRLGFESSYYVPTLIEYSLLLLGIALFFLLVFVTFRFVPVISIFEQHKNENISIKEGLKFDFDANFTSVVERVWRKFYDVSAYNSPQYKVGLIAFLSGCFGVVVSLYLVYYAGFNYKLNLSGKPFFSIITAIPIVFEVSLLLAGIGSVIAFFLFYRKN